jgi:hypothetical protein
MITGGNYAQPISLGAEQPRQGDFSWDAEFSVCFMQVRRTVTGAKTALGINYIIAALRKPCFERRVTAGLR